MGLLSKAWRSIKKLTNFLNFGLISKIGDWLKPDLPAAEGIKVTREGADLPIPVVYGKQKIGPAIVHKYVTDESGGAENDTMNVICVFCEGEIESFDQIYFDDVISTDPKFNRDGGGKWFEAYKYTGTPDQPASAEAVSEIPNWTIKHKLSGLAYIYFKFIIDSELSIWSGIPEIKVVIKGKKVLDTRTGIVSYSENGPMCLRDYLTNDIYGRKLPDTRIHEPSFNHIADQCDQAITSEVTVTRYEKVKNEEGRFIYQPVTYTEQTSKPRFTCNVFLDTSESTFDNISKILSSFRGILPSSAGEIKLSYETTIADSYGPEATIDDLFELNDDNIVGDIDVDSGDINDRYNVVEVRFPNKLKNYETDSVFFPAKDSELFQQWFEEDYEIEQPGSFKFDSITSKDEALQMAEILAKRSRFSKTVGLTGFPICIILEPGDIVAVTNSTHGWERKPFRVTSKIINDDDTIGLALSEHEDNVYPWSGRAYDDVDGGSWLGDPFDIAPPTGLGIVQDKTLSKTGVLSWSSVNSAFVRKYGIRVIKVADADGLPLDPQPIIFELETNGNTWAIPLLDTGSYEFGVRSISTTGAVSGYVVMAVTLTQPAAPSSLIIIPTDWTLEVRPQLAGIGLGTVFEFDITSGIGGGYTPAPRARGSAYTATGLLPDTLYTVYARSINAYGESEWVSEQATTTITGAQVEPFLDTIRQELDSIELISDDWNPARDVAELFTNVFEDYEQKRDISATITRVEKAEVDLEGNAVAINGLMGDVYNSSTGLGATYTLAAQAKTTADGYASSIAAIETRVTDNEEFASSQLVLNSEFDNELGTLSARAFLGTNVNDQITGVVVGDDGTTRQIEFIADSVVFLNSSGTAMVYYDTENGRYVFDGHIIAQSGTFSGNVSGATITGGTIETSTSTSVPRFVSNNTFPIWIGQGAVNSTNGLLYYGSSSGELVYKGKLSVKSATSGQRTEIDDSQIRVYDSSGTLRVRMGVW